MVGRGALTAAYLVQIQAQILLSLAGLCTPDLQILKTFPTPPYMCANVLKNVKYYIARKCSVHVIQNVLF